MISVNFEHGSLIVKGLEEASLCYFSELMWDKRILKFRAKPYHYRNIILKLRGLKLDYVDQARKFVPTPFELKETLVPRPYQQEALEAWRAQRSWGMVVLPTGAGKTVLAVLAIAATARPVLIHVPTLDLMHQWYQVLKKYFKMDVGLLGGGTHELRPITVATYDSALIHVNHYGNQFGLLIFDESHHLPGDQYQFTAISALAPFRLGLSATPPNHDARKLALLEDLCGPKCYEAQIQNLVGLTLAPYEVVTYEVDLSEEEKEFYEKNRLIYKEFLKKNHINFSSDPYGWKQFISKCYQTEEGRQAFKAYLSQKKISQSPKAKLDCVFQLIQKHAPERMIIFTQDNATAYLIGKKFLLPVITHLTKIKEREDILEQFRSGQYLVVVTSKVLNEGVDVPEASVGIIVSGSGTVREHVQRLGRILRAREGKKAILYEIVSKNTAEYFVNKRRKNHDAYKKTTPEI